MSSRPSAPTTVAMRKTPTACRCTTSIRSSSNRTPAIPRNSTWAASRPSAWTRRATTSALWRTTGNRPRWVRGGWAGKSGSTARRSPSTPISSRRAGWRWTRSASRSPMASTASSCICKTSTRSGTSRLTGAIATAKSIARRKSNTASTTMSWPTWTGSRRSSTSTSAEAEACIARGLVIPAHDFVLRQSHTFNLLDARGAIGVTERAKFFAAMRNQARAIAELYVEQRAQEEYPWLDDTDGQTGRDNGPQHRPRPTCPSRWRRRISSSNSARRNSRRKMWWTASRMIEEKLADLLTTYRLGYQSLRVTGTPRRLVAYVTGLAPRQTDETVEKRGPSADRAYDPDGSPTKAAQGFARGQGVAVEDLVSARRLSLRHPHRGGAAGPPGVAHALRRTAGRAALGQDHALERHRHRLPAPAALDRGALWRPARDLHLGGRHQRQHQPRPALCRRRRRSAARRVHDLHRPHRRGLFRRHRRTGRRRGPRSPAAP